MDFNYSEGTYPKAFQDMMSGTFVVEYPEENEFNPTTGSPHYRQLGPQLKFSGIRVEEIGLHAFNLFKVVNSLLRTKNEIKNRINFLEQSKQYKEANIYKECLNLIERALNEYK